MNTTLLKLRAVLVCALIVGAAGVAAAGPLPDVLLRSVPYNGHEYTLLNRSTWTDAQAKAVELGGTLVTINDATENAWVTSTFGGGKLLWMGLNDLAVEGTYEWLTADGNPISYTNWNVNEPNNYHNEDYTSILSSGKWNDTFDNNWGQRTYGVVEVAPVVDDPPDPGGDAAPEPLTMLTSFAGISCLGVYMRKRRRR